MTTWDIELPLIRNLPPLNHNQRLHWREKANRVALVRSVVNLTARQQHIPAAEHIRVQLNYWPGDRRRRDAPNLTATSKPAIDGLVDAGVVPDDNDRHVTEVMPAIHTGTGPRRLWLHITLQEPQ